MAEKDEHIIHHTHTHTQHTHTTHTHTLHPLAASDPNPSSGRPLLLVCALAAAALAAPEPPKFPCESLTSDQDVSTAAGGRDCSVRQAHTHTHSNLTFPPPPSPAVPARKGPLHVGRVQLCVPRQGPALALPRLLPPRRLLPSAALRVSRRHRQLSAQRCAAGQRVCPPLEQEALVPRKSPSTTQRARAILFSRLCAPLPRPVLTALPPCSPPLPRSASGLRHADWQPAVQLPQRLRVVQGRPVLRRQGRRPSLRL